MMGDLNISLYRFVICIEMINDFYIRSSGPISFSMNISTKTRKSMDIAQCNTSYERHGVFFVD